MSRKFLLLFLFFGMAMLSNRHALAQFTTVPFPFDRHFRSMSWPTSNTGYVVRPGGIDKSIDGGNTWASMAISGSSPDENFILQYSSFQKVLFVNENTGFICGGYLGGSYDVIAKTNNGGLTWRLVYSGEREGPYLDNFLVDMHFFDIQKGEAVGFNGHRVVTIDGGETWTLREFDEIDEVFREIKPVDSESAILVGEQSLRITRNRGLTWTSMPQPTNSVLQSAHFFNSLQGMVSTSVAVFHTSDGGTTWVQNPFEIKGRLYFRNATHGYLLDENRLYTTEDGGNRWELVQQSFPSSLVDVFFISANTGWLAGSYGYFGKTVSGIGATLPLASFAIPAGTICPNVPAQFINHGLSTDSFQWLVNDEVVSSDYNLIHTFSRAGDHTVSLKVFRNSYVDVQTQSVNIYIPSVPAPFEAAVGTLACSGFEFRGNLIGAENGTFYSFEIDGRSVSPTIQYAQQSPAFVFSGGLTTSSILTIKAFRSHGCGEVSRTIQVPITIIPSDHKMIVTKPSVGCEGQRISITIQNSLKGVYYNCNNIPFQNIKEGVNGPITFDFEPLSSNSSFTLEALLPCPIVDDQSFDLAYIPQPTTPVSINSNGFLLNETVTVSSNSTGSDINWDLGDGRQLSGATPPSFSYADLGRKTIRLSAQNLAGCTNTRDTVIYVTAPATASTAALCNEHSQPSNSNFEVLDSEFDQQGNLYQTGYDMLFEEFPPNSTKVSRIVFRLQKINSQGGLVWEKRAEKVGGYGSSLAVTADQGVLVAQPEGIYRYTKDGELLWHVKSVSFVPTDLKLLENGDWVTVGMVYGTSSVMAADENWVSVPEPWRGYQVLRFSDQGLFRTSAFIETDEPYKTQLRPPWVDMIEPAGPKLSIIDNNRIALIGIQNNRFQPRSSDLKFGNLAMAADENRGRLFLAVLDGNRWVTAFRGPLLNMQGICHYVDRMHFDAASNAVYFIARWKLAVPEVVTTSAVMENGISYDRFDGESFFAKWSLSGTLEWIRHLRGIEISDFVPDNTDSGIWAAGTLEGFGVFDSKSNNLVGLPAISGRDAAAFHISFSGLLQSVRVESLPGDQSGQAISKMNCGRLAFMATDDHLTNVANYHINVFSPDGICNRAAPTLQTNIEQGTICKGQSLQLAVNGSDEFQWFPANGLSSTSVSNPIASPQFTTTYTVTGTTNECSNSKQILIEVEEPLVDFEMAVVDNKITVGLNTPNQVIWNFGDGSSSSGKEAIHVFQSPGSYEVCASVDDLCESRICKTVTITCDQPSPDWQVVKNGLSVQFTPNTQAVVLHYWTFGDGNESTSNAPSHIYSQTGSYEVCLRQTNGCLAATLCRQIMVCELPQVSLSPHINGRTITFSGDLNSVVSASWSFGDGSGSSDLQPTHIFESEGIYSITAIFKNACGEAITRDYPVQIVCPKPISEFNISADELHVTTSAAEVPNSVYQWNFGGGMASGQSTTFAFATEGSYTICLTVSNQCGVSTACREVTVCQRPLISFEVEIEETSVIFVAQASNTTTLNWTLGDGSQFQGTSLTHDFAEPGSYEICLEGTNTCYSAKVCQLVNIVITGLPEMQSLNPYPNPCSGKFEIEFGNEMPDEVELISVSGQILKMGTSQITLKTQVDISSYPDGVYLLKIRSGKSILVHRVVKIAH